MCKMGFKCGESFRHNLVRGIKKCILNKGHLFCTIGVIVDKYFIQGESGQWLWQGNIYFCHYKGSVIQE